MKMKNLINEAEGFFDLPENERKDSDLKERIEEKIKKQKKKIKAIESQKQKDKEKKKLKVLKGFLEKLK